MWVRVSHLSPPQQILGSGWSLCDLSCPVHAWVRVGMCACGCVLGVCLYVCTCPRVEITCPSCHKHERYIELTHMSCLVEMTQSGFHKHERHTSSLGDNHLPKGQKPLLGSRKFLPKGKHFHPKLGWKCLNPNSHTEISV